MKFKDLKEFSVFQRIHPDGSPLESRKCVKIPEFYGFNAFASDGMGWMVSDLENVRFIREFNGSELCQSQK